jgi:hypothetical protein
VDITKHHDTTGFVVFPHPRLITDHHHHQSLTNNCCWYRGDVLRMKEFCGAMPIAGATTHDHHGKRVVAAVCESGFGWCNHLNHYLLLLLLRIVGVFKSNIGVL